ncbi:MAG: hypothetical protein H0U69_03390 [Trueperaceae bacterium]|nr:hypothetical protein [Trueperaceae bacterium]
MRIPPPPCSLLYGPQAWQVFRDDEDAEIVPRVLEGTWEESYVELMDENDRGAGIYYTVNETRMNGRRRAEDIIEIRAWYTDIDGIPDEGVKRAVTRKLLAHDLPPSLIVETRNGVHALWYAVPGADLALERYRDVEEGVIGYWGGDQSVKDIARVLRAPGFAHRKRKAGGVMPEPFISRVLFEAPEAFYLDSELQGAFPPPARAYRRDFDRSTRVSGTGDWDKIVDALFAWYPVPLARHRVLTIACGVALKFGVSEAQAVSDLSPIVTGWDTGRDMATELKRTARWAYQRDTPATVTALRREGVAVPTLSRPED